MLFIWLVELHMAVCIVRRLVRVVRFNTVSAAVASGLEKVKTAQIAYDVASAAKAKAEIEFEAVKAKLSVATTAFESATTALEDSKTAHAQLDEALSSLSPAKKRYRVVGK